jgi:hypothetical protein
MQLQFVRSAGLRALLAAAFVIPVFSATAVVGVPVASAHESVVTVTKGKCTPDGKSVTYMVNGHFTQFPSGPQTLKLIIVVNGKPQVITRTVQIHEDGTGDDTFTFSAPPGAKVKVFYKWDVDGGGKSNVVCLTVPECPVPTPTPTPTPTPQPPVVTPTPTPQPPVVTPPKKHHPHVCVAPKIKVKSWPKHQPHGLHHFTYSIRGGSAIKKITLTIKTRINIPGVHYKHTAVYRLHGRHGDFKVLLWNTHAFGKFLQGWHTIDIAVRTSCGTFHLRFRYFNRDPRRGHPVPRAYERWLEAHYHQLL